WTAEQIGHLLVKYESEWYADEELSKWNEIDNLYEQEKQQKKEIIEEELNKLGLTLPYQRDSAMKKVDEAHEYVKSNWQLEKEERIKPSLWWKEVAQAQAQNQTTSTEQSEANTPKLSNLSADGKAWFIHPVAMMDYFNVIENKKTETWDSVTNSRIALLHPRIRQHTLDFINDAESKLNLKLRVSDGYRSIEEQNKLYDKGRKNSDPIVTKVKGGYSFHNYGLAIDVVEILDKKAIYFDNKHPKIKEIVEIAKSYGFLWGGDWVTFKDYPHFEFRYGFTTTQLLKKYNAGDIDDEGYVNIN
ncbi:M15 family metallopeptidase, partial [Gilliamella sp. Choc6-1]|uniref:M15 family metallopeptidase n=1 Tax=Gilliamella sp. Choc6-1 TaxID=3120239 RepID=UPI001146F6E2